MCQYKLHFFSLFFLLYISNWGTWWWWAATHAGTSHLFGQRGLPIQGTALSELSFSGSISVSLSLSNPRPSELKCYIVKSQNKVSIYHNAVYFYRNKSSLECFKLEEVIFTDIPCACVCAHSHVRTRTHTHTQHANYILVGIVWNWKIYLVC